jgi:hypothetical protein
MKKLFIKVTALVFTSLCLNAADPYNIIATAFDDEARIMLAQLLSLTQASQPTTVTMPSPLLSIWSLRDSVFQQDLPNFVCTPEETQEKFILPDEEQKAIEAFHALLRAQGVQLTDSSAKNHE